MNGFVGAASGQYTQYWPVKNESGEEIPPFACMRIVGTFMAGYDPEEPWNGTNYRAGVGFRVMKPNTFGSQTSHIFNGPRPIPTSGIGEASVGLIMFGKSASGSLTNGSPCGPRNGSWYLHPSTGGFVCWEGNWADFDNNIYRVVQQPLLTLVGKADNAIASNTSGDVTVYWGGATATTGEKVSAYNRGGDGQAVDALDWVHMIWSGDGFWEIIRSS